MSPEGELGGGAGPFSFLKTAMGKGFDAGYQFSLSPFRVKTLVNRK